MIPTSATYGLKRLDDAVLKPGDIVLTTTTAAVSKAIRVATGSDISHAMVCVEDRSVIDATGEGVHARNTQRLIFEEEWAIRPVGGEYGASVGCRESNRTFGRYVDRA
jgi:hypothetical protein